MNRWFARNIAESNLIAMLAVAKFSSAASNSRMMRMRSKKAKTPHPPTYFINSTSTNKAIRQHSFTGPDDERSRVASQNAKAAVARLSHTAPSSPVHNRRFLSARGSRMSSIELPDEEKSISSASASPCHSPSLHRIMSTGAVNLFVALYNFKPRHSDELELKAGYKLTVLDSSDPDWWKGKYNKTVGVFPSSYVTKLLPGEKPLQVSQSTQINSTSGDGPVQLLRDQIVIQVGDELRDGLFLIRTSDHRQGACSVSYLQEV